MKNLLFLTLITALIGCASDDPNKRAKRGAAIGAATGAVAGSTISKDKRKGALIGGFLGTVAGGSIGKRLDKQAEELNEIAETSRTDTGVITKLKGDITFDTGEAKLTQDARKRIDKIGEIIADYPEDRITVEGHTDSTGPASLNEKLSERRAMAVKEILTQAGVPAKNITIVGLGSSAPISTNATQEGRAANRRVEINIQADESELRAE